MGAGRNPVESCDRIKFEPDFPDCKLAPSSNDGDMYEYTIQSYAHESANLMFILTQPGVSAPKGIGARGSS